MAKPKPFDVIDQIIAYEDGKLEASGVLDLFSHLIKNGMAWTLQGSYGRMASNLITNGYISRSGEITPKAAQFEEGE